MREGLVAGTEYLSDESGCSLHSFDSVAALVSFEVVMRRILPIAVLLVAGCADTGDMPAGPREDLFAARAVKIHPVFTRITDWTGDGKLDGIDALVELRDQFGDTTKGAGTFTFELFEVRQDRPDGKGRRVSDPWHAEVITPDQQRARWSKTSRCYTFRLQSSEASKGSHMLAVTYAPAGGGPRSFDQVVLTARATEDLEGDSTTQPTQTPPPAPMP
jgi:hypothetical protein